MIYVLLSYVAFKWLWISASLHFGHSAYTHVMRICVLDKLLDWLFLGLGYEVLRISASYTRVTYSERKKTIFCQRSIINGGFIQWLGGVGEIYPSPSYPLDSPLQMLFTARRSYASAVLGVVILSVRPSVCLSHVCFVTNPKNLPAIFLYHMKGQSF